MATGRGFLRPCRPSISMLACRNWNEQPGERSHRWETVLLLGDRASIAAARNWHECAWSPLRSARIATPRSPLRYAELPRSERLPRPDDSAPAGVAGSAARNLVPRSVG